MVKESLNKKFLEVYMLWKTLEIKMEEALKSWSQKAGHIEKCAPIFNRLSFELTQIVSELTRSKMVKKKYFEMQEFQPTCSRVNSS